MTRLLLIILLFLSSSPAYAEWVKVGESDESTIYSDPDTIRSKGNLVKVWSLYDYKAIHTSKQESKSFLSGKMQVEHDCAEEQLRTSVEYGYSGQMGTGELVFSHTKPVVDWTPVMPGSVGQSEWDFACGKGQSSGYVPEANTPLPQVSQSGERSDKLEYERLLGLFRDGDLDGTRQGFAAFLRDYPNSDLSPNARYWLGESHYGKKDYKQAIDSYDRVILDFPQSEKVASAILKKGYANLALKEKKRAVSAFKQVVTLYPGSPEAGKASDKLAQLKEYDPAHPRIDDAKKDSTPTSTGTGFVVSRQGHVLTNHHVVEECTTIRVTTEGYKKELTVIGADAENDLVVLKLSAPAPSVARFREGRNIRSGDGVVVVGFPLHGLLATEANVTIGTVSALAGIGNNTRFIQITAPVQPGNSGGPLLDQSGNVVGVVVSKLNALTITKATGDIPQNINFAINGAIAKVFLESYSIAYETGASVKKLEPAEIGVAAKKFTLLVECYR